MACNEYITTVPNFYVIEVKFLDVDLVTYFLKIMAISEVVSVVLSGPATILALNEVMSRKKNLHETIFPMELLGNSEYTPQVGRYSPPSCVSVQGILLVCIKSLPVPMQFCLSWQARYT